LFLAPASRGNWTLAILSGVVFGLFTLGTMVALVLLGLKGIERLPFGILERWSFALTGIVVGSSGLAVLFLGL
jgi:hypothetical protein